MSFNEFSSNDSDESEEERRIAYVAVTRAKNKLYLTTAKKRLLYGNITRNKPSQFLLEFSSADKPQKKINKYDDEYAMYNLALSYYYCYGVEKDYNKAFDCYLKAVYKRCPYAFYRLGWLYREGLGTEKNVDKAWEYYQRALNMQYSDAMTDVGIFYRYGEMGVEPDYEKAVEWLNKAADKGNAKAMYELADMYLRGEGVKPDFKYAKNWYLKALRAEDKIVDGFNTVKSQIRAILNPKKE